MMIQKALHSAHWSALAAICLLAIPAVSLAGNTTPKPKMPTAPRGAAKVRPQFLRDVAPILDRKGCSTAGCHGKFGGRGGFQLSLLTLAPADDFDPIVRGARGRRVNLLEPDKSLVLQKALGNLNHAGGQRFADGSFEHQTIRNWIANGAPFNPETDAKLTALTVTPPQVMLPKVGANFNIKVIATFSDGTSEDVTQDASYESSDTAIATVEAGGRVTGRRWGGTGLVVRYLGEVRPVFMTIPRADATPYPQLPAGNVVDKLVLANLKKLNVTPSRLTSDTEFLRRVSLDLRGKQPTSNEIATFTADKAADKRSKVIDAYLASDDYIDVRTLRMGDLLRIHPERMGGNFTGQRSAALFSEWIRDAIAENRPYNEIVQQIIIARGSTLQVGPANFYKIDRAPEDRMETVAQAFLGQRMACARCHKHPFDKWSTDDYWNFAAFMGKVGTRGGTVEGEEFLVYEPGGNVINQSVTGKRGRVALPTLLGEKQPLAIANIQAKPGMEPDVLDAFAKWCTAPDNTFFARATVNRLWSHYLGRGIVHPVDDMRVTTPVAVPGLLEALSKELIESNFDIRHITKLILNSRTYQTAAEPNATNTLDDKFFSRFYPRPMLGQVFLDVLNEATGSQERFGDYPVETKAKQLSLPVGSYFMDTFGRSHREFLAELEPKLEPTLVQTLHILNSAYVNNKLRDGNGVVAELIKDTKLTDAQRVDALYLRTFCRLPEASEKAAVMKVVDAASNKAEVLQDLLWALVAAREFTFIS